MKAKVINPEKVIGLKFKPYDTVINLQQYLLYALSIGFCQDPTSSDDLKYTFEGD